MQCICIVTVLMLKRPNLSMLWIEAVAQFKRLLQKITFLGWVGIFVLIFILPKKNRSGRIISAIDKQKAKGRDCLNNIKINQEIEVLCIYSIYIWKIQTDVPV